MGDRRVNAGYTIICAVPVGSKEVVLGRHETAKRNQPKNIYGKNGAASLYKEGEVQAGMSKKDYER